MKKGALSKYLSNGLILLLGIALVFSFVQSQTLNHHTQSHIQAHLSQLNHANTVLNELILKIRYRIIRNYDPVNETLHNMQDHLTILNQHFAQYIETPDFKAHIQQEKALLTEKSQQVEQFISRIAILSNSLNYARQKLLELEQKFLQQADRNHADWYQLQQIRHFINQEVTYNHTPATFEDLKQITQVIRQDFPTKDGNDLLPHLALIQQARQAETPLLLSITNPTNIVGAQTQKAFNQFVEAENSRANHYKSVLFFLAYLLVFFAFYSYQKLRQTLNALKNQQFALDQHAIVSNTTPKGKITYVNDHFCDISGYRREELLGKPHNIINSGYHSKAFFKEFWRTIKAGKVWKGQIKNRSKSGKEYWVNSTIVPFFDASGKLNEFISIRTDITAQKKLEQNLIEAKKLAEAASLAKSDFIATMSHEIRTPMNGIIGMTELVLDSELTEEQRDHIEAVKYSADSLMVILNDILDFSKIESGKFELHPSDFTLSDLCQGIIVTLQARAKQKGIQLIQESIGNIPDHLIADAPRLRQILLNLAGNAVKFTHEGAVTLRASLMEQNEQQVILKFEIIDTGIGISKTAQATIFSEFTQEDSSVSRKYGGTGLGLAISSRLVELMQGEIGVHSEMGQGSNFYFTLPFAISQTPVQPPIEVTVDAEPALSTKPLEILLVEDNPVNQKLAKLLLEKQHHQVEIAENGLEALTQLKEKTYDLIFMDMQMPEMDGITATVKWRAYEADYSLPKTPIIAMTANAMEQDKQACLNAGMDGFIAKPIKIDQLYQTLKTIQLAIQ